MYFKTMEVFWVQFCGFAIATIIVYITGFYYTQIHSPVDAFFHDHITLYKVIGDLLTSALLALKPTAIKLTVDFCLVYRLLLFNIFFTITSQLKPTKS